MTSHEVVLYVKDRAPHVPGNGIGS
jgi:hypothetical protein